MKYLLPEVETKRLIFRLLNPKDFENWLPLFSSMDVARFLGLDESLTPEEMCQKWFDKVFHRYENDLGGMHVLVDKTTRKMVGQCGLLIQEVEGERRMEIGYSVLPEYWGMGYASEAAQKCKEEGFTNGFTENIMSMVHIDNKGSETVAKRNGMVWEKIVDKDSGNPMNIFSIQKSDWESSK